MSDDDAVTHTYELPSIGALVKLHVSIIRFAHSDTISFVSHKGGSRKSISYEGRLSESALITVIALFLVIFVLSLESRRNYNHRFRQPIKRTLSASGIQTDPSLSLPLVSSSPWRESETMNCM